MGIARQLAAVRFEMRIAIVGSGKIGSTLAQLLSRDKVVIDATNSRCRPAIPRPTLRARYAPMSSGTPPTNSPMP
jgi:glycerol-3-phosphate dehydrogenase